MNADAIAENRHNQLAQVLDPASIKIDGRSNRDRLAFVAAFSQLILYYDQHNQCAGDWQSFFMKDPCILYAAISKTDYSAYHAEFMLLEQAKRASPTDEADYVNRLIPLLKELFATINKWFYFMGLNASTNSLYLFLKKVIDETLADQLCAMRALQQALCTATGGRVTAPDTAFYSSLEPVWLNGRNTQHVLFATDETAADAISSLTNKCGCIFHSVFDVFVHVIEYAAQAFAQQESQATPYPDTALLMAFSQLMETQQKLINQFSTKHLDFYYERILQQSLQPARADQVFVCLKLADKTSPLTLPAGTLFKAGNYPDNSEIVFASQIDTVINHAMISSAQTLYYEQTQPDARVLYLNTIANPAQVSRNALQEIISWDGFGNNNGRPVQQGFALASPMLFLQGGQRTISVVLAMQSYSSLSGSAASSAAWLADFIQTFPNNQFYLSTESAWFILSPSYINICPAPDGVAITITLPPEAPAIVAFTKNPDGFSSAWPILKIMLGPSVDLRIPPSLTKVNIQVQVDQFSHFSLSNTSSLLPNMGAQQLFGPVPAVGDCFYIGSAECFAKPLCSLTLDMHWDKLPANFCDYYAQYNQYLSSQGETGTSATFTNTAFTGQWSLLISTNWQGLTPETTDNPTPPVEPAKETTILERIIQLIGWFIGLLRLILPPFLRRKLPLSMPAGASSLSTDEPQTHTAAAADTAISSEAICLFQQASGPPELNIQSSSFSFRFAPSSTALPQLALSSLPAVAEANNGYLRFCLEKPDVAFGNCLYAQVISYISFTNAQMLISKDKKAKPLAIPNTPYSPKLAALQGSYSASAVTAVSPEQSSDPQVYPFELYHYGSFKPYLAYDATNTAIGYGFCNLTPNDDAGAAELPLFAGVGGPGCLYLSFSGVVAPCSLSVFAEISADTNLADTESRSVGYYYWTNCGWQPIKVLQNDTNDLTCSGIITFDIPSATAPFCPMMPNTDFWLAIATKSYSKAINIKISYLDTQAMQLTRVATVGLPVGDIPRINANSISATQKKLPQIISISQPFSSFGGLPAENRNSYGGYSSFYRRVSERLNNKDRSVTTTDLVNMAHCAYMNLFYAKAIPGKGGEVRLGLVRGYPNVQQPNAFLPAVDAVDQKTIEQYLACRASAMTKLSVFNLKHQIGRIFTTLLIDPQANANAMVKTLNQQLRIYLSPWIKSDLPQRNVRQDITCSEVIRFLSTQPGVVSVSHLSLIVCVAVDNDDEVLLVSHQQHAITVVPVAGGQV